MNLNESVREVTQVPEPKSEFWLKFVLHQFIGVWGVLLTVALVTALPFQILRLFGEPYSMGYFCWILSGRPYFPIQIGLGIFLGWVASRYLWHRSMVWVWVLPFAYLSYAFVVIPTLSPNLPPEFQAGVGQSRFSHYFGWGCGPWNHCRDQLAFTVPFYIAAAYSIGALIARKVSERIRVNDKLESAAMSVAGIWFFLAAACDFYFSSRGERHLVLPYESVAIGIGALLMLLAYSNLKVPQPRRFPNT